jgi:hypothetical protein
MGPFGHAKEVALFLNASGSGNGAGGGEMEYDGRVAGSLAAPAPPLCALSGGLCDLHLQTEEEEEEIIRLPLARAVYNI